MTSTNYWTRRFARSSVIRGTGLGIAGLAGAALLGCGGTKIEEARVAVTPPPSRGTALYSREQYPSMGKVGPDQVRITPGVYTEPIPPTPAERDIMANGRYGGTLHTRYLDPPSMDFNRTLSCTINSTMDYTKNKLTRAAFGPYAEQFRVTIEPDLAEKWEINGDATQFTFHLRKGVKFHNVAPVNGREFTSDDVKASVERYRGPGVQRDVWSVVDQMEFPDNYTAIFKLNQPLADFPTNIAAWSHMDARELIEAPDILKAKAIGTGPFLQESWVPKERSVFVRHPDYFERGLPFLDRVITDVQEDTAVTRAGFSTDNWFNWSATNEQEASDMTRQVKDAVYQKVPNVVGNNTSGMHFQMKNPRFQDERVRRAISLAIDRVEWDQARYSGEGGGYALSPIPWPYLHSSRPKNAEQGPWYQYNPAEASKLLQAAGYSATNKLTIDAPVWYARNDYRELMLPMFQKVAEIDFKVRQVDNPTAVQMLNDRNYEDTMNITYGPPVYAVDQALYPFFHSKAGLNHNNVNDPEMDRLVTAQRRETNPERQKELWQQAEDRIFDQVWQVYWCREAFQRTLWHNYVINIRPHGISGALNCYGDGKARSIWLDAGAPNASAIMPPVYGEL